MKSLPKSPTLWSCITTTEIIEMELTAKNVADVYESCLHNKALAEDEPIVIGAGVLVRAAFAKSVLEENKENIVSLCSQLRPPFYKDVGGGWSFLNMCMTDKDVHWGEHRSCDMLVCLALAAGIAEYPLPRNMWDATRERVPYITFTREVEKST